MSESKEEENPDDPLVPSKRNLPPQSISESPPPKKIRSECDPPYPPSPLLAENHENTQDQTNIDPKNNSNKNKEEEIEDGDDDDDEESEEEEEDDEEEETEASNGKGKGVIREEDYKGKGKSKIVEESSSDSDSDSDFDGSGGGEGDNDSDFSDDPLAEVDLDNILPSRTRRKAAQPGAYLTNDMDDDDDDNDEDCMWGKQVGLDSN